MYALINPEVDRSLSAGLREETEKTGDEMGGEGKN